jgi:hypothetical protein
VQRADARCLGRARGNGGAEGGGVGGSGGGKRWRGVWRGRRRWLGVQTALFNFTSLLTVLLLFICTCAYLRPMQWIDTRRTGFAGVFFRAGRIGERRSDFVALACILMALYILFSKSS